MERMILLELITTCRRNIIQTVNIRCNKENIVYYVVWLVYFVCMRDGETVVLVKDYRSDVNPFLSSMASESPR